jgi:hypothetical protein
VWLPLLFFVPGSSFSMEVDDLYDVVVPVQSRDADERIQAFKQALSLVLVRITGNQTITSRQEVSGLLSASDRYVEQYRYTAGGEESPQLLLQVNFDGEALERYLNQAALPIWGKERPVTLVWLAVQDGSARYLLSEGQPEQLQFTEPIQATAKQRGLPLLQPLWDLQDQNQVSLADIIGGFDGRIYQASQRYQADAVLVGRAMALNDGIWQVHWHLLFGDQSSDWVSQSAQLSDSLVEGINQLATELASRLTINYGMLPGAGVMLSVAGVDTLEDYARLNDYIANLSLVNSFWPNRIEPGHLSFWIKLRGDPLALERLIRLGGVLQKVATPAVHSEAAISQEVLANSGQTLNYQLLQ